MTLLKYLAVAWLLLTPVLLFAEEPVKSTPEKTAPEKQPVKSLPPLALTDADVQAALKKLDQEQQSIRQEGYLQLLALGARVEKVLADKNATEGRTDEAKRLLKNLQIQVGYRLPVALEPALGGMVLRFAECDTAQRRDQAALFAKTGKKHAIPLLKAILEKDPDYAVRRQAAVELLRLGDFSGAEYILGAEVVFKGVEREQLQDIYQKAMDDLEGGRYLESITGFTQVITALSDVKGYIELRTFARYNLACSYGRLAKALATEADGLEKKSPAEGTEKTNPAEQIKAKREEAAQRRKETITTLEASINDGFLDLEHIQQDDFQLIDQGWQGAVQ